MCTNLENVVANMVSDDTLKLYLFNIGSTFKKRSFYKWAIVKLI